VIGTDPDIQVFSNHLILVC